jgi:hypothetical protein
MASSVKTWVNGEAPTVDAADYNGFELENNNLIESAGLTLDDEDHDQTGQAVAVYSANGDFYTGTGAANTYSANPVGDKYGIFELQNGMQIRFVVPTTNTGASTINVNSLGVLDLKRWDGSVLQACDLIQGEEATIKYNLASDEWRLITKDSILALVPPIGSIIPWDDFNGAVTFFSDYYAHMNGDVLSDAHSPLDGETLTDCSGRYLVGFGTDGGADIDTAAWDDTPLGNAGNEIDISHRHIMMNYPGIANQLHFYDQNDVSLFYLAFQTNGVQAGVTMDFAHITETGGAANVYTKSGGSATTDIQPISIPVRFLVRKR